MCNAISVCTQYCVRYCTAHTCSAAGAPAQVERLVLEQLQEASTRVGGGGRGHELQGRLVYALARLYRSVKREAQRTGEWSRCV